MKKLCMSIAIILIMTSVFGIMPISYADYAIPSYVRIGLYFGGSAKSSVTVTSENGFYIGTYAGTKFAEDFETVYTELNVSFSDNHIVVKNHAGETIPPVISIFTKRPP